MEGWRDRADPRVPLALGVINAILLGAATVQGHEKGSCKPAGPDTLGRDAPPPPSRSTFCTAMRSSSPSETTTATRSAPRDTCSSSWCSQWSMSSGVTWHKQGKRAQGAAQRSTTAVLSSGREAAPPVVFFPDVFSGLT